MESKKLNNLSKRQQITASSKTVFLWVAGASILAAFSVVAIVFLFNQMVFNEKVLATKATTERNLKSNVQTAGALKSNVNLLLGNEALNSVKTSGDSSNLQVILDALPTSYDAANFGASLQGVLLNGTVAGIGNLSVVAPNDNGYGTSATSTGASAAPSGAVPMPFTMTITGSPDQIKTALMNMEASIRPIQITALTIDGGSPLTARISGQTFYDPSVNLKLQDKVIKP
jgi:hypothetical protein